MLFYFFRFAGNFCDGKQMHKLIRISVKRQINVFIYCFLSPTGELTQGELYSAIKKEKEQTEAADYTTTVFSGEIHFYELVEDTKDGIWLVQVKIFTDRRMLSFLMWGCLKNLSPQVDDALMERWSLVV